MYHLSVLDSSIVEIYDKICRHDIVSVGVVIKLHAFHVPFVE